MPTWPVTLPPPAVGTFSESPPDNSLRTQMDKGPAKTRRRTTANTRPQQFTLKLIESQVETLDDFYTTDTLSGTQQFDFTHPRTLAAVQARFVQPPSYTHVEADNWTASLSIEIMP